jgi:NAD(P)H-dependent FMN reductase
MTTYKVGYFVGSLSSTSINRLLAQALIRLAPPRLKPGLIEADGRVTVESTEKFLREFITEFYEFIERVYTALPCTTSPA